MISANDSAELNDYRRQLCRQLTGQVAGSFVRPLNELLAPLNHHEGPVLICFTQADKLPDSFLQELWDLVLQSRFANNKQHLNVLLFGQPAWAERAKTWLPAKNSDKPLLLRSESVMTPTSEQSELDRLIADKRAQFDKRLRSRAMAHESPRPVLANWWQKLLIASVFVLTFASILVWQYVESPSALWAQAQSWFSDDTDIAANQGNELSQSTPVSLDNSNEAQGEETVITETTPAPEMLNAAEDTIPAETADETGSDIANTSNELPITQDALVTTWEKAIEPKPTTTSNEETTDNNATSITADDVINADVVTQAAPQAGFPSETSLVATPVTEAQIEYTEDALDYPVEDITDISQLPSLEEQPTQALENSEETVTTQENSAKELETIASSNDAYDNASILALPPGQVVLQLAGISQLDVLNEYMDDFSLQDKTWVYKTQRFGGDWYVVLHNQAFSTIEDARAAASQIETNVSASPFAKQLSQVHSEIRNSQ